MIIVEGPNSVHIAAPAALLTEDRELAWAEPHVIKNPAYAWVLGKYVSTGNPNDNGHIFDLEELRASRESVVYAPMNMLHAPQSIMGAFVANELVYPTGANQEGAAVAETTPYLEALAVFWKFYFPEAFETVRMAHNEGSLAWSMECVPETVTCAGGCDATFPYMGRQDASYCDHLNGPGALKKLNKPHFTAGALVVPPARPAWKNASVTELSVMVRQELEGADKLLAATASEFPDLEPAQWESMMGELILIAKGNPFAKPPAKKGAPAKPSGPHAYTPVNKFIPNAVCKVCGKKPGDAAHGKPKAKAAADPQSELRKAPHAYAPPAEGDTPVPANAPCKLCGQAPGAAVHAKPVSTPEKGPKAMLDPVLAVIAGEAARDVSEGWN